MKKILGYTLYFLVTAVVVSGFMIPFVYESCSIWFTLIWVMTFVGVIFFIDKIYQVLYSLTK